MNNERYNQIIDDAYKSYKKKVFRMLESWDAKYSEILKREADGCRPYSQDIFIKRIRTDAEFSKKWGLKIEERELSYDEKFRIAYQNLDLRKKLETESKMLHFPHGHNKVMDDVNIPTKLLTVTYNNEIIDVYE